MASKFTMKHELTRIEDQFREMKGTLETRPVFVRTREHIKIAPRLYTRGELRDIKSNIKTFKV